MTCDFCGSASTRVKKVCRDDGRTRCRSEKPCRDRMRTRTGVKVVATQNTVTENKVTVFLEGWRDLRNRRYIAGQCCDCGVWPYSPGWIRCGACHVAHMNWRNSGRF